MLLKYLFSPKWSVGSTQTETWSKMVNMNLQLNSKIYISIKMIQTFKKDNVG